MILGISDTVDFWQHDKITGVFRITHYPHFHLLILSGDPSTRRLKLWEENFEELLSDQLGREVSLFMNIVSSFH